MAAHHRFAAAVAVAAAAVLLLAGCASSTRGAYDASADPGQGPITIGADGSAESRVIAALYAGLLTAAGEQIRQVPAYATTEQSANAVVDGAVALAPAYESDLLRALPAAQRMPGNMAATLSMALPVGIDALPAASAQRGVVIAVSRATAQRYGLRSLVDLARAPGDVTLANRAGGDPDVPSATALAKAYGVTVGTSGAIQLLVLRGTDPAISRGAVTVLADPKSVTPPEHVFPLINADYADKRTRTALARIDSALTTEQLAALTTAVSGGEAPAQAAGAWLRAQKLVG